MKKTLSIIFGVLILALSVLAGMGVFQSDKRKTIDVELVAFAQCLEEKGAIFYGAFWCPHCQNYKPKWKEIEAKNNGRDARPKLRFVSVDCTDGTPSEASKFGIEGYPTVLAIVNKNGKQVHTQVRGRDSLEEIEESVKNM